MLSIEEIVALPVEADCPGVLTARALPIREIDGWQQQVMIFQPAASTLGMPAIMLVHGGGFQTGHPEACSYLGRYLALHLGVTVFAPNYRLGTPESPTFPKPVDDVAYAWSWLRENAAAWNVDAGKLFVGGSSAGGALTALSLTTGRLPGCQGLVELWGPLDFITRWFDNGEQPGAERNLLGVNYPENPSLYHQASALTHVAPGLPPAVFIYGRQDPVVHKRQGALGQAAWRAGGSRAEYAEFDNIGHAIVGDNRDQLCKVAVRVGEFLQSLI
ncbi:alpha/beta hydrolase [Cerasicoccus frondis]|uniref:alpha/beta hydrolase n=1 Tax=Cerasicoccus frondis TaxID=490090 RepID=UPI002852CA32|nr:alpha/beta hydrolase [Cerasicoccus frondis]